MKSKDLTKDIQDKYPKVWEKLTEYVFTFNDLVKNKNFVTIWLKKQGLTIYDETNDPPIFPFNMLYALLEDFFEDNGIYIDVVRCNGLLTSNEYFFTIFNSSIKDYIHIPRTYKTKNEAKYQAALKACEILEDKLNG